MDYDTAKRKIKESPLSEFKIGRGAEEPFHGTSESHETPSPVCSNCDDPTNTNLGWATDKAVNDTLE
jgi:hypothetical protein